MVWSNGSHRNWELEPCVLDLSACSLWVRFCWICYSHVVAAVRVETDAAVLVEAMGVVVCGAVYVRFVSRIVSVGAVGVGALGVGAVGVGSDDHLGL